MTMITSFDSEKLKMAFSSQYTSNTTIYSLLYLYLHQVTLVNQSQVDVREKIGRRSTNPANRAINTKIKIKEQTG